MFGKGSELSPADDRELRGLEGLDNLAIPFLLRTPQKV
jgi:hypothetical protein